MTISASNPSNIKPRNSTGGNSTNFFTESRHKKYNNSTNRSLKGIPFMKLPDAAPPTGIGNLTQTIHGEDQSIWSNSSPLKRTTHVQISQEDLQQSHQEIVSILATDILSYCSGAVGRDESYFLSRKNINSLHISSLRGNADYCNIAGNCLDFESLRDSTFFKPDVLSKQSAYLGTRVFPTLREQLPSNYQDYEYPETLLIRYQLKETDNQIFNEQLYPENVIQGKFKTCCFAAALVALVNHDCLFDSFIVTNLIKRINGVDFVTLFFNGQEQRFVPVKRRLLVSDQGILLNTHFEDLQIIGFSLMEKAMQILYSSPDGSISSNMAIQLYHLTGWIPEVVFIKDITNHQFLWEMLSSNFREGNIMLGFGVKEMAESEQIPANKQSIQSRESRLILNHAYTVLIFEEETDKKCIQFKNPWGKHPAHKEICEFRSNDKSKEEQFEQGIFTLSWENVLKYFQCISLVWNPKIYPHFIKTHETWRNPFAGRTIFTDPIYCLLHFPQYLVRIKPQRSNSEIRLLLERHHTNSLSQQKGIGVKLFQFEQNRVAYTHQVIRSTKNASETVNSDVFVFEASRQNEEYVFVVFFDSLEPFINYTLTIFSFTEVEIAQIPPVEMKKQKLLPGFWHQNQQLGPIRSSTFLNSAQFKLSVYQRSSLRISAECDQDLKIQVMIIASNLPLEQTPLGRIESAIAPGFYFERFSVCEALLDEGQFIVVLACKNESTRKLTNYKLYIQEFVESTGSWKIEKREEESKELVKQEVQGRWEKLNSMGSFKNLDARYYQAVYNNPSYLLHFKDSSSFQFHLQPLPKAKFPEQSRFIFHKSKIPACGFVIARIIKPGEEYQIVYSSEFQEHKAFGCKTPLIYLKPSQEGYIIVCTTDLKGYEGDFKLRINSPVDFNIQTYSVFSDWKNNKRIVGRLPYKAGKYKDPSYHLNLQYCLKSQSNGKLLIQLFTLKPLEIALHVFRSKGLPISKLKEETLSEPLGNYYQQNCVTYVFQVAKGVSYSLVPSCSFKEKDKMDNYYFVLTIGSIDVPFEVKEIAQKNYESNSEYDLLCELENGRAIKEFNLSSDQLCHFRAHAYSEEQSVSLNLKLWEITDEGYKVIIQDTQSSFSMGVLLHQQIYPNKNGYLLTTSVAKKGYQGKIHVRLQLAHTPAESMQVLIL